MKFDSAMRLLFDYGIVEFSSQATIALALVNTICRDLSTRGSRLAFVT